MAPTPANEPVVEYSVKDLLNDMRREQTVGFTRLDTKLDGKADRTDLAAVQAELASVKAEHGAEIGHIKDKLREDEAAHHALSAAKTTTVDKRRWLTNTITSVAIAVIGALSALAAFGVHL